MRLLQRPDRGEPLCPSSVITAFESRRLGRRKMMTRDIEQVGGAGNMFDVDPDITASRDDTRDQPARV